MKKLYKIRIVVLVLFLSIASGIVIAQDEEKPELLVSLHYFNANNNIQHLDVQTRIKANKKINVVKDVVLQLYLDSLIAENLIAKVRTNNKGQASSTIPVSLKDKWTASANHKFIAVTEATRKEDETVTELEVIKARISIDTLNEEGTKSVIAQVLGFSNGEWVPAKDVELKLGIRRLGGDLKIGEEENYTTDSLGQVKGEFKVDSLPTMDVKGNIVLVAKTEDNELYGNLSVEKTVPWGTFFKTESRLNQRSLWATRDKAPLWLLLMACSIIAAVWSVIIYLVFQLFRIKKLGNSATATKTHRVEEYS